MTILPTGTAEQPLLRQLAPGVFARQEVDNMGWVDMGDSILVVDTLEQPTAEAAVWQALRETVGDRPVGWVLNTHTHPDHVALNPAFERAGAEIINARTRELPASGLTVEGKKRSVQMLPMPGCHSHGDCVVWLPAERILFVGDLFGWGLIPWMGNLTGERKQLIVDTYRRLLDLRPQTLVPGHGPLCGDAELRRWLDYFLWLIDQAGARIRAGIKPAEIDSKAIPPPPDMLDWWRFRQWKHADSLKKVVKALARNRAGL